MRFAVTPLPFQPTASREESLSYSQQEAPEKEVIQKRNKLFILLETSGKLQL